MTFHYPTPYYIPEQEARAGISIKAHTSYGFPRGTPNSRTVARVPLGEFDNDTANFIVAACNAHAELIAMLESAVAYVELFTGDGVQKQPDPKYRTVTGDFDAEAIAKDARALLAKVTK